VLGDPLQVVSTRSSRLKRRLNPRARPCTLTR
jgi:hypothetical protein